MPDLTSYRRGGVGVVFTGQTTAQRPGESETNVGLKMLTGIDKERFAKLVERSTRLSAVAHPNLARHIECFVGPTPSTDTVDEDECDQFFSVHEWVVGTPLNELIPEADPVTVLLWGRDIAAGLDYLHNHSSGGFAHRDVHARNIIVRGDDSAVLIDYDTILWGASDDTNIASLSSIGGQFTREPGLAGAQAEDVRALAATLLRAFARDSDSLLNLEELTQAASSQLWNVAKDPVGVVQQLVSAVQRPKAAASELVRAVETRFDSRPPRYRASRKTAIGVLASFLLLGVASTIVGLTWPHRNQTNPQTYAETTRFEVVAQSNPYRTSDGKHLAANRDQQIVCRVEGPRDKESNFWWYQVASAGGSKAYYAPAKAFLNHAKPSRPIPNYDSRIPQCRTPAGELSAEAKKATTPIPSFSVAPAPAPANSQPPAGEYVETTGGTANTWSNYSTASGSRGPVIPAGFRLLVACRVQGFRVPDGNTDWYRIASAPWNDEFYVTADAFYNNGRSSGSLHGTPYFDPAIPNC